MSGRSLVACGAALLLAFVALIGGVTLITAEQAQQQSASSASTSTGTLDAAAVPAAAQPWIPFIEAAGSICAQITAPLIAAQIQTESGWNPNAASATGAEGLAQFEPGTWATWGSGSPLDPPSAIAAEGKFMCALAAEMSSLAQSSGVSVVDLALAAYNAGSAPVIACGCIPNNGQTSQYVQKIDALAASFTVTLVSTGGDTAGLATPLPCPAGAVQVSPGAVPGFTAGGAYCFAAGTYNGVSVTLQSGERFYGQGAAVLNGGAATAFNGNASDVLIDGFTIQNYAESAGDQRPGVINLGAGSGNVVSDNTVGPDGDAGIQSGGGCSTYGQQGGNNSIVHNVVFGQGGSGVSTDCQNNDVMSFNRVSRINLWGLDNEGDVHAVGKCAFADGTQIVGNYVSDSVAHGIWCDVFATDTVIADNTVTNVSRSAIFYELSYNAVISGNTVEGSGRGAANAPGNPGAGISISSSGANPAPGGPRSITISNNTVKGNLLGIVLFDGHPNPVNHVIVSGNTLSGNGSGVVDAEPGLNTVTGNNVDGAPLPAVLTGSTGPSPFGLAVVAAAAAELDKPYLWGGAGPGAFDCSGLVMVAVEAASHGAILLPHSSEIQATLGQAVTLAAIQPGDVIAFALSGGSDFDHIGIYVGDGYMIDAPHTGGFVRLDKIIPNSYWQAVPWQIRRFG